MSNVNTERERETRPCSIIRKVINKSRINNNNNFIFETLWNRTLIILPFSAGKIYQNRETARHNVQPSYVKSIIVRVA